MNGFDLNHDCAAHTHYRCYTQYAASGIPNLSTLAEKYVISDRTFSENPVPSWGGHIDLIAGQLDGFEGVGPTSNATPVAPGPGWGCNSNRDTPGAYPTKPLSDYIMVPSCIPRPDGYGPYRPSPVKSVPTILDSARRRRAVLEALHGNHDNRQRLPLVDLSDVRKPPVRHEQLRPAQPELDHAGRIPGGRSRGNAAGILRRHAELSNEPTQQRIDAPRRQLHPKPGLSRDERRHGNRPSSSSLTTTAAVSTTTFFPTRRQHLGSASRW